MLHRLLLYIILFLAINSCESSFSTTEDLTIQDSFVNDGKVTFIQSAKAEAILSASSFHNQSGRSFEIDKVRGISFKIDKNNANSDMLYGFPYYEDGIFKGVAITRKHELILRFYPYDRMISYLSKREPKCGEDFLPILGLTHNIIMFNMPSRNPSTILNSYIKQSLALQCVDFTKCITTEQCYVYIIRDSDDRPTEKVWECFWNTSGCGEEDGESDDYNPGGPPTESDDDDSGPEEEFDRILYGEDIIINEVDCDENPCLCSSINKFKNGRYLQSKNLSNEVSLLVHRVFGVHSNINLTITTSSRIKNELGYVPMDKTTIARNSVIGNYQQAGFLNSKIEFNSDYQINCSRAHLTATLLHESIHAYIDAQRAILDPHIFNQQYPLFANRVDDGSFHHATFAADYIRELVRSLQSMHPGLSYDVAEALSWEGLGETQAFKNLSKAKRDNITLYNDIGSCQGSKPIHPSELKALGMEPCL